MSQPIALWEVLGLDGTKVFSKEWRLESPDFAGVMKNITGVMFNVQAQIAEIRLERPKTAMMSIHLVNAALGDSNCNES